MQKIWDIIGGCSSATYVHYKYGSSMNRTAI